jgi:hypothetical protein
VSVCADVDPDCADDVYERLSFVTAVGLSVAVVVEVVDEDDEELVADGVAVPATSCASLRRCHR